MPEPKTPPPPMPDPAEVAWQKAYSALGRLFDALDALDEAGGLERVATAGSRSRARRPWRA